MRRRAPVGTNGAASAASHRPTPASVARAASGWSDDHGRVRSTYRLAFAPAFRCALRVVVGRCRVGSVDRVGVQVGGEFLRLAGRRTVKAVEQCRPAVTQATQAAGQMASRHGAQVSCRASSRAP